MLGRYRIPQSRRQSRRPRTDHLLHDDNKQLASHAELSCNRRRWVDRGIDMVDEEEKKEVNPRNRHLEIVYTAAAAAAATSAIRRRSRLTSQ
jgi:hypothetical protein